jgi:hypothetical protein
VPPKTEKQRRAAGAELGRRRRGVSGGKGRAFGTASVSDVRDFAKKPKKKGKK